MDNKNRYIRPVMAAAALDSCAGCLLAATGDNGKNVSGTSITSDNRGSFQYEGRRNDWGDEEEW